MEDKKQFEIKADDVDSSIINITRDGEDFAWFLSDIVTDKQVEKVVDKLNELNNENKWLKQQLLYDGDDVCGICKHEYLTPWEDFFIGKCEKGHEECSKKDIKYCEDFELIQVDFEDLIKRMDKELKE